MVGHKILGHCISFEHEWEIQEYRQCSWEVDIVVRHILGHCIMKGMYHGNENPHQKYVSTGNWDLHVWNYQTLIFLAKLINPDLKQVVCQGHQRVTIWPDYTDFLGRQEYCAFQDPQVGSGSVGDLQRKVCHGCCTHWTSALETSCMTLWNVVTGRESDSG